MTNLYARIFSKQEDDININGTVNNSHYFHLQPLVSSWVPGAVVRNATITSLILPSELHTSVIPVSQTKQLRVRRKVKYKVTSLGFQQKSQLPGIFLKSRQHLVRT